MNASLLEVNGQASRRRDAANLPPLSFSNGKLETSGASELRSWVALQGEVPLKACYGGRGAGAWRSIVSSAGYELGRRERSCLGAFLSHLCGRLSAVGTVVHLGSGDGAEIPIILQQQWFHRDLTYVLVDISPDLIDLAAEVYCSLRAKRSLVQTVTDVETEEGHDFISAINPDKPRLLMLVANGALLSDPLTWQTLWNSMRPIDYAMILLEVADFSTPEILAHSYQIPAVQTLLYNGLRQAGFGEINEKSAGYSVQVAARELMVTWTPSPEARQRWETETGRDLQHSELVLLRSIKPSYDDFRTSLGEWGFDVCESLNHHATQCAGFLVRRSA